MRRSAIGLLTALALSACASAPAKGGGEPTAQQQKVSNISYFDLENCFPVEAKVSAPANKEGLTGFLVAARPEIGECLVDPKNRGPERLTRAAISVSVTDQGAEFQAAGDNLTPSGVECIRNVLKQRSGIEPLPKGAPPASASIDYQHNAGVNPAVVMGVNESSDAVGTVRLAMKGWCECFEPWRSAAPRPLSATMVLVAGTKTPTEVSFIPPADDAAGKVQACVSQKLKALEVPHSSQKLTVPVPFILLHSGVDEAEAIAPNTPEIAFLQLDALRSQRAAQVALAIGGRVGAVGVYDALVAKYKANPRSVTVKELRDRCQALLQADEAWISALDKQRQTEERTLAFAQKQQARDASWGEAVAAARGQVQATQKELEPARQTRQQDEGACPKVTYK
ncbi:MAG TPA: hypothetical protein VE782_00015 [Myxococcaceae bacterium]|nr:hypothetical protein [Myxococcaceae bacterium]